MGSTAHPAPLNGVRLLYVKIRSYGKYVSRVEIGLRLAVDKFSLRSKRSVTGLVLAADKRMMEWPTDDGGQRRRRLRDVEWCSWRRHRRRQRRTMKKNNNNNNRDDGRAQLYCPRTRVTAVRIPGSRTYCKRAIGFSKLSAQSVFIRAVVFVIPFSQWRYVNYRVIIDFVPNVFYSFDFSARNGPGVRACSSSRSFCRLPSVVGFRTL